MPCDEYLPGLYKSIDRTTSLAELTTLHVRCVCSWVGHSTPAADSSGITILPRSASLRGTTEASAPESVDADLRRWITTGRAPLRAHLVDWLLRRVELVKTAGDEGGSHDAASREDRQQAISSWSLVISKDHATAGRDSDDGQATNGANVTKTSIEGTTGSNNGRTFSGDIKAKRQQGGRAGGESKYEENGEEGSSQTRDRTSAAVSAAGSTAAVPRAALPQLAAGGEGVRHQWQWWDSENPWSKGSRSSASTDANSSESAPPPPPVYREVGSPPPYQEVVTGPRAPRSSLHSSQTVTSNAQPPLSSSLLSKDAGHSSGDDTSRGPPPSYRTAAAGRGTSSFSSSFDEEEEGKHPVGNLPPPSYGRYYEALRSTPALPDGRGETGNVSPTSEASEWWAQEDPEYHYQPRPDTDRDGDRGRERERRRRRKYESLGRGGGKHKLERPETIDDEGHGEDEGQGVLLATPWARRKRAGERRRSSAMAVDGGNRPRTTTAVSRRKNGHKDHPVRRVCY